MANPVTSIRGSDNERTYLFWITDKAMLALDQFPDDANLNIEQWSVNNAPVKGNMLTPNNIAAFYQHGMIKVYGMYQKDSTKAEYTVAELSPTLRFITNDSDDLDSLTTTTNRLAAVSDKADLVWFYYLNKDNNKIRIATRDLRKNALDFTDIPNTNPSTTSRFAALWLPETSTRLVFFQIADKTIWLATITQNGDSKVTMIDNTGGARDGTPMALTFTGDDKNRVIYLYFFDNLMKINRSVASWNQASNAWSWDSQPLLMKNGPTNGAIETTQITASHDGKQIRVYAIANGKRYNQFLDTLKTF